MSTDPFKPGSSRAGLGPLAGPLSRRGLLRWSAVAAAAAVLPAWAAPAAAGGQGEDGAYAAAFLAAVAEDKQIRAHLEPGREFWYRPGQLLAARADVRRVAAWLREAGVPFRTGKPFGTVGRFLLADDADIPALVAKLREPSQWKGGVPPEVQPHHVLVGYDNIMGNPGTAPVAVAAPIPPVHGGEGKGVMVGVCDTGIWRDAPKYHPDWLGAAYAPEADDEDSLYRHDDVLELQGGHGTFVAGVLRRAAPDVSFDPEVALSGLGIGDEEMLVGAIDRLDRRVSIINLSLGCRTQDDVAPLPIADRLAALDRDVVVVAAAGNAGGSRPAWPAALPRVLAVAAVRYTAEGPARAEYSNFGPWVDACADGTRTSTYVTGVLEVSGANPERFDCFAQWTGTSFAAPYVAGQIAALMSAKGLSAADAADHLLNQQRWHPDFGVLVP
ncbi:S8/S53 family peptidase [Actinoplanes sp. NPDC049118]|uniref:S8 family peptidase n=1 Tax=Actinoplanes sp. NPDC049118 TaxID=3155769 RepID=UPI0033FE1C8B